MKLVAPIRLLPSPEQNDLLRNTLETCNAACNWLAELGAGSNVTQHYDLHKIGYRALRVRFGLAAQVAVRCIAKVADAFKVGDKDDPRRFKRNAAQPFDARIVRILPDQDAISIGTLAGRQRIAFVCADRQREMLASAKGEVDLMFVRGKWMLAVTCDAEAAAAYAPIDVLGIDLGIVNLAVSSSGHVFSGAQVENVRRRHAARRRALQKKGTRSANRALRRASGRQARFQRHTNHCISEAIVAIAQRDRAAVALEDLEGIRDRVQAKRRQRARLHNWGFHEQRSLLNYKAMRGGVPVVMVDPRNTSRECPCCGLIDKRNRKTRNDFQCVRCGFAGLADHVAGINIRTRGLIATGLVVPPVQRTTPSLLSVSPEESRLL